MTNDNSSMWIKYVNAANTAETLYIVQWHITSHTDSWCRTINNYNHAASRVPTLSRSDSTSNWGSTKGLSYRFAFTNWTSHM